MRDMGSGWRVKEQTGLVAARPLLGKRSCTFSWSTSRFLTDKPAINDE
jgi:hypothetical protein